MNLQSLMTLHSVPKDADQRARPAILPTENRRCVTVERIARTMIWAPVVTTEFAPVKKEGYECTRGQFTATADSAISLAAMGRLRITYL